MHLRRIFIVAAIAFGVPLMLVSSGGVPSVVDATITPAEQQAPTVTQAVKTPQATQEAASPSTVGLAVPMNGSVQVEMGSYDIPATALVAYKRAAKILAAVKPSCDLSWPLLAGIGEVESHHGQYAGAILSPDGVSTPRIVGVALDGQGPVAAIPDTDQGRLDGDTRWDRAVGPMQFLPSTWNLVGVDADGNGVRDINDINDAALAAGVYLCAGSQQGLGTNAGMEEALRKYNDSSSYVDLVMAYESEYSGGDFKVTTPDGGAVESSTALASRPLTGLPTGVAGAAKAGVTKQVKAAARHAIVTTKKHHATRIQVTTVTVTTVTRTTYGSPETSTAPGRVSGSSSSAGTPSGTTSPSTGGGTSTGATTGGSSSSAGTPSGTTSPSTGGRTSTGATTGGSSSPATPGQSGSGSSGGSSGTPSGTPTPTPTPTSSTTTGVLGGTRGAYTLGGTAISLVLGTGAGSPAKGDIDGDGAPETNEDELVGLIGRPVTIVAVRLSDGTLAVSSVNGVALG